MKITKTTIGFEIIFELMLISGMLAGYTDHVHGANIVFLIILIYLLVKYRMFERIYINNVGLFWMQIIFCVMLVFNVLSAGSNKYLFENIVAWTYSIEYLYLMLVLHTLNRLDLKRMFKKNFFLLNGFWIINLFVLTKQVDGTGFMIKNQWLISNSLYVDQCAGLFGNSATHQLTFFSLFMLAYDWGIDNYWNCSKVTRYGTRIFIIVTEMYMCILSQKNDNTAFFLLLPIVFLMILFIWRKETISKALVLIKKNYKLVFGIMLVIGICVIEPHIRQIILDNLEDKISVLILNRYSNSAVGGSERLAIFFNALRYNNGWMLGRGLGYTKWFDGKTVGFIHFGISDLGSVTMLCGIWIYLLYTGIYCKICAILLLDKNKNVLIRCMIFGYFILLSVYSNIDVVSISAYWTVMLFVALGICNKKPLNN